MIGDLISILLLIIIWINILKLKKTDFGRFLFELTIYFISFVATLLGYKIFFGINRFFFPEELYPSVIGVFAVTVVAIYFLLKISIFFIKKKDPETDIENRIYAIPVKTLSFINPTDQDFHRLFLVFSAINFIIIGTLLSSLPDAFTFKSKLFVNRSYENVLLSKEKNLINSTSGNDNFKYNIERALEFVRLTNPYYHRQIIENTRYLIMSENSIGMALASANPNNYSITLDPKYGQRRYNSMEEFLALSTILVHESQHLKDFKLIDKGTGFNPFYYIGGGLYFKLVCNPITNYENFQQIIRATSISFDEWCAQIEETKFIRMYNIDYTKSEKMNEVFSK